MRAAIMLCLVVALSAPLQAAQIDSKWFDNATGMYDHVAAVAISKPDYLPGTTRADVCRVAKVRGVPVNPLYEMQAYDPAHHLVLANFYTDGCHVVIFSATLPANAPPVRKADLSGYQTARGLRVGSSYAQVRQLYGAPANASSRFVLRYKANTGMARAYGQAGMVQVPEQIVLLVKNQRVASIAVLIDLSVLA